MKSPVFSCAIVRFVFILPTGWYGVCDIEYYQMSKTSESPTWFAGNQSPNFRKKFRKTIQLVYVPLNPSY